ncbi:hypothetical protein [Methylobacterium sp. ID0610]|uniref:hypothetical protein n=1 Tax=Methylobacterium carpenticola TaxID=3344827 RepID=UPI0036BE47D0
MSHRAQAMNDFVALLFAALAFCAGFLILGWAVEAASHFRLGSPFLSEGNFLQVALALGLAVATWRRATRRPLPAAGDAGGL